MHEHFFNCQWGFIVKNKTFLSFLSVSYHVVFFKMYSFLEYRSIFWIINLTSFYKKLNFLLLFLYTFLLLNTIVLCYIKNFKTNVYIQYKNDAFSLQTMRKFYSIGKVFRKCYIAFTKLRTITLVEGHPINLE